MTPVRVAIFTNQFPGRVSTFFARDVRALIEAGVEVDVFPLYPLTPEFWQYVPDLLSERELPRERVHHLRRRDVLRTLRPWRLLRATGFLRDTASVLASAVRFGPSAVAKSLYAAAMAWAWAQRTSERYDHVLAYWANYPGTSAWLFHRLTDAEVPFTLCVHAQIDLYETPVFLAEKLLAADDIVTVCEYNRQFMRTHYPAIYDRIAPRIDVNYRGLDLAEYPWHPDGRAPRRVLAVGRLSPEKAYDDLIRAIAELRRRGVEAELEIAGEGPEREALTRLVAELQLGDRVTFRGWLVPDEARRAMCEATVLAQTSHIEGLPTVVEEALALGIPVVGSRVGGIPELLDHGSCGSLVTPGDVPGIADALQALLADPALRRTFAERGRAHAEATLDMWRNGARWADRLRALSAPAPVAVPAAAPVPVLHEVA